MSINYAQLNDQIVKIARGLGYTIKMYDEKGSGPISDSDNAKYIYLEPDGIMISMPTGKAKEFDEVIIWHGHEKDNAKFANLSRRTKLCAHMLAGLGQSIKLYNSPSVVPAHFADEVKKVKEKENNEL